MPSHTLKLLDGALSVNGELTVVVGAFSEASWKLPELVATESVSLPVTLPLKVTGTVTFTCVVPETETGLDGLDVPNVAVLTGETCGVKLTDPVYPLGLMAKTRLPGTL